MPMPKASPRNIPNPVFWGMYLKVYLVTAKTIRESMVVATNHHNKYKRRLRSMTIQYLEA